MKLLISILFSLLLAAPLPLISGEDEKDFNTNFNIAKQHLSQRRINKALPFLLYLQEQYPKNSNLKYLVGLCYAEEEIVNPATIKLLKEASKKVSLDYDPNSLEEQRVPIYVYYYLSVAYSQNKNCEEAENARNKFLELYPHKDKFYIEASREWINRCAAMTEQPKIVDLPSFPEFKPYQSKEWKVGGGMMNSRIEDSLILLELNDSLNRVKPSKIITKEIAYSTLQPLYGVQLGAFKDPVPVSRFKLKNIDAFMDSLGMIRYVIGHFSIQSQAESLLKIIKNSGYEDAFVVNVNDAKKYKEEVISVNDVNIKAAPVRKAEYRIQVGAFKEELTSNSAKIYLEIEGIKELRDKELTYLTVGKFSDYESAKTELESIIALGIKDAFVIAVLGNKKIPLQNAVSN